MSLTEIKGIGEKTANVLSEAGYNLENIKDITVEKLEELGYTDHMANKLLEDVKTFFEEKLEEKPIEQEKKPRKIGRYRLKKQLRRKFPEVDKAVFRDFFRTTANKYDNLQDMTEAFKSYQK